LVFSSDYPHISFDEPTYIARLLPAAWQRKVFCENACELFGWSLPAEDWVNPALAGTGTR
jgi:predicted TIM-barrel fold metal-dependent hydrolase